MPSKTKKQFTHEGHPHLALMRNEWDRYYWGMMMKVAENPASITREDNEHMKEVLALQGKLWKLSSRTGLTADEDKAQRHAVCERVKAEREARARDAEEEHRAGHPASFWSVSRLRFGRRQHYCEEVLRLCGARQSKAVLEALDVLARDIAELERV